MSSSARPQPFHEAVDAPRPDGAPPAAAPDELDGTPIAEVTAAVEKMDAKEAIGWAVETFGSDLRFATSFQKTSSVMVDLAKSVDPSTRFFYLDTDLLFRETYDTRDALERRYGFRFERYSGISLAEQEQRHGANLWRRQPDACCGIRKVEPMRAALHSARCWVAGIRRSDSQTRASAPKFGWDRRFGLWKLNPLADWSDEQIWNHLWENDVPYNSLHDQGYPSIGCTHCTAPPGADGERSGRWADFDKTECGLNG